MRSEALILGGAGLIGSSLARRLLDDAWTVTVVDNCSAAASIAGWRAPAWRWRMNKIGPVLAEGDVRDTSSMVSIIRDVEPRVIFYLAALLASEAAADPDEAEAVQVEALGELLRELRPWDGRLVLASSSYVYGDFLSNPADESHPLAPIDAYGALKVRAERLVSECRWIDWVILRPAAVYGVGDPRRRYASVAIESAVARRRIDLDYPDFIADFTYVEDVARAFAAAASSTLASHRIFNATCGEARTNREFCEVVQNAVPDAVIVNGIQELPLFTPRRGALNSLRAETELAWRDRRRIDEGVRLCVADARAAYGVQAEASR